MSDRGHVFIVDGDASSADPLQQLLEGDGYSVGSAPRGGEALEGIAEAEPNLVLLDAHLADVDPFELLEQLKLSEQARDIPVIFMTTLDDSETRLKGLEAGDVRHGVIRRVASAVGQGAVAVSLVHKYLETV